MDRIYREPKLILKRGRGRLRAGKRPDRYRLSSVRGGGSTHIQVLDYGETLNCNAFRQIYLIDQNTTKKYSLNIKIDLFRQ